MKKSSTETSNAANKAVTTAYNNMRTTFTDMNTNFEELAEVCRASQGASHQADTPVLTALAGLNTTIRALQTQLTTQDLQTQERFRQLDSLCTLTDTIRAHLVNLRALPGPVPSSSADSAPPSRG